MPSEENTYPGESNATYRIQIRQSPYLNVFYQHHPTRITIDSGATGNMIRLSTAKRLGLKIQGTSQSAHQADGSSPLHVVGEVNFTAMRDQREFVFHGLVVENLDVDMLGGTPFMERNNVAVRPAKREILLSDGSTYNYGSPKHQQTDSHTVRRAHLVRAPAQTTIIWPGDFIELDLPDSLSPDDTYAIEPRIDSPVNAKSSQLWPSPDVVSSIAGKIRIPNDSTEPKTVNRFDHICQVRPVFTPITDTNFSDTPTSTKTNENLTSHSAAVQLDPDRRFSPDIRARFRDLLDLYDDVFSPELNGYNGASGPFESVVNMGPVQPPQRKGRLPLYSRNNLVELQRKFDELQASGVFVRPENAGVTVEYLNPSFLIKKSNGGFRLVTAFADVGRYSKPQPSVMSDVDSTLRQIGQWKHIISTDLSSAFYQIPLSRESMKYCGVTTPFRGVLTYARCAMGIPGSETALEELMSRVLGDLLLDGIVAKLADDLYCGGQTPDELLTNWERLLQALNINGLRLSPQKTVIGPSRVSILGWIWENGTIQASSHRISTLASCPLPSTVRTLRSFIGAYKVLARVIPHCSSFITPLDALCAGRQSQEQLRWTDELIHSFQTAQKALSSSRTIVLPNPNDQLWIVTDGSVKQHGLGATLYITRNGKLHLSGFFSAKLKGRQTTWLPCEIEALSIAVATKHFHPYIIQSKHNTCLLTDSKPCVQAFEKLCRGEFSASPRVSTFMSTVSRYQVSIRHLDGSANLPSDFASRNACECTSSTCQVCSFVHHSQTCVVLLSTTKDILSGKAKLPFTTRSTWLNLQSDCPDLRRTHAHLKQGTRPSKKLTDVKDVKRYLNSVTIAKDGLLVVRKQDPFEASRDCIVVPRQVLDGLLTSLHIQLDHPSAHQMKLVARRNFLALDMDQAIERTTISCHHCQSLKNLPKDLVPQSTGEPPSAVGTSFATDIMRRERQFILVLRECITSFTSATIVADERHETLREALLRLCIELRPIDGPPVVVRTDNAPGFKALADDKLLNEHRVALEICNPVAERAIQELENELLHQDPQGGAISSLQLSIAVARLNSRIRSRGLSAREMWLQRDQYTNNPIRINDQELILSQNNSRHLNHPYSEQSKAPHSSYRDNPPITKGDIVYLHNDRNKSKARNRYLVTTVEGNWCNIQKFSESHLRSFSYRVKKSECYKVPTCIPWAPLPPATIEDDEDDEIPLATQPTSLPLASSIQPDLPLQPDIPPVLTMPGPTFDSNSSPAIDDTPPTDHDNSPQTTSLRRSNRPRAPPKWLSDYNRD